MKRLMLLGMMLCGCGGSSFESAGLVGVADPVTDGGLGSGGARDVDSGAGSGGASTGGAPDETGSVTGTGGSSGAATGGAQAAGGVSGAGGSAPVCLTDLSGVGTGDFSIHFTLTTTESIHTLGLMGQRTSCDDASVFWDISLNPTGGIVAATSDGSHRVFVEAGNSLNDGKPHRVDVIRRDGMLWYASDGEIHSTPSSDPYALDALPPLVFGSSACSGIAPSAGRATISEVCLTEP